MYVRNAQFFRNRLGIQQNITLGIVRRVQNVKCPFTIQKLLDNISSSVLLLIGFLGLSVTESHALPIEVAEYEQAATPSIQTSSPSLPSQQAEPRVLQDGIYLYGQTPKPDEIGQAYLIFESRQDHLLGAFYMPHSSFDCFYGMAQPERLKLTVVESYTQEPYAYSVALTLPEPIATLGRLTLPATLQGFHHIIEVSENDQRLLNTCRVEYQDAIWN
ncbi:MAG: hypothetical protein AAGF24_00240 [Cyanobacteria bacterium P01_H01_bin.121]